jgi:hypothetical protein
VVVVVDPPPPVLVRRPSPAGDPVELAGEVVGEPEQEFFGGRDPVLGEGEDGVLLGVGWHHMGVVPFGVRSLEVAAQLRGDVEVGDLVPVGVAGDPDHSVLRLAVLIGGQLDFSHSDLLRDIGMEGVA